MKDVQILFYCFVKQIALTTVIKETKVAYKTVRALHNLARNLIIAEAGRQKICHKLGEIPHSDILDVEEEEEILTSNSDSMMI